MLGQVILGKYKVIRLLDEGGMSKVYLGRQMDQNRDVVIKVLKAAHRSGIVHRDIKPGNLMILHPGTSQETLKLMDFGLARMASLLFISADEVSDWTLPGASGTPEYISPEQVRGQDMDSRGDLYSVGVVLFEMLTGRRPFEHSSVEGLLLAHAEQVPPSFAELGLVDRVSPAIEA